MPRSLSRLLIAVLGSHVAATAGYGADPIAVTVENFIRAESNLFFGNAVKEGGFGKFHHRHDVMTTARSPFHSAIATPRPPFACP